MGRFFIGVLNGRNLNSFRNPSQCTGIELQTSMPAAFIPALIQPRARAPHDLAPFGGIGADHFGELFRRATRRLVADDGEAIAKGLRLDRPVDRRVELVDDRPWHARWRDYAAPRRRPVG